MKIYFYFGHPSQYLFLRETIKQLKTTGNEINIYIKTKDVLEDLLSKDGQQYVNIHQKSRGDSKISILISLIKRILYLFPLILKSKPDLLISADAPFAIIGKILNINRITFTEDDYSVIKTLSDITYPFTHTILCPRVCDVGKWKKKKVAYSGYMKLGYLHPNVFTPDKNIVEKYNLPDKYAIVRLAKLNAHHDFGIQGINTKMLKTIISKFKEHYINVFISSEDSLEEEFLEYSLNISPSDIHHVLFYSSFFICDSQSMTVEAALLGVPSIRYSSFVGKISVLEELEHKYRLTYGIHPDDKEKLLPLLEKLLSFDNLNSKFEIRRRRMLEDKINISAFMYWFIVNYPQSHEIMIKNPEHEKTFINSSLELIY